MSTTAKLSTSSGVTDTISPGKKSDGSTSSGVTNVISPEKKSDGGVRELLDVGLPKLALTFATATEKETVTEGFKLTPNQSARNALSERVKVRLFDIFEINNLCYDDLCDKFIIVSTGHNFANQ